MLIHSNLKLNLLLLAEKIGKARYVLIGEATHGTSEFYLLRSIITQHLIQKLNFSYIGVEGDWPDCYRINRYVKNYADSGQSAVEVLGEFQRWPTWMWANWEVAAFCEWLKSYNAKLKPAKKVGFYGVDVYSLWESLEEIMNYLKEHDPKGYEMAKKAYYCFEPYGDEASDYANVGFVSKTCEDEVLQLLQKVRGKISIFSDDEDEFVAAQNALVLKNSEEYYRGMFSGGPESWNTRDRHMVEVVESLSARHGADSKCVIWEHNTHVGDARATDMKNAGMVNVGQLLREKHGDEVFTIGFGTYEGSVIAARGWGVEMEVLPVPQATHDSWEGYFHRINSGKSALYTDLPKKKVLNEWKGHRAIGVVYNPLREDPGNYVPTHLSARYDAFIYLDKTTALHPLYVKPEEVAPPETYPWGF